MYVDTLFVFIWLLLPVFWHYLLRFANINLLQITIPGLVILFMYIYQYVGLPILYFQLNEYRFESGVNNKLLMLEVSAFTAYTISFMIFGFLAGRKMFGSLIWRCETGFSENVIDYGRSVRFGLFLLFILCLSVLLIYLRKIGFDNIAIFTALGLNEGSIGLARSSMGNAFTGKFHRYYLFMNELMLFVVYAYFALYLAASSSLKNKVFFYIVFLVTSFSMVMATEKAPMAYFLIALFLIYVVVKKEGRIPLKQAILFGSFIVSVLILFYILFMGSGNAISALSNVFSRAFTGAIQPSYHYLEFFPTHHDFLYGKSFPNPGGLFPYEPYQLTKEVMAWHSPGNAELGIVGSMPAVYWGEMYANFGMPGVLMSPFFVGLFLYWINSLIFTVKKGPLVIALFVWMIMHLKNISSSSLSNYLIFYDTYMLATVFFYFIIAFFAGQGVVKLQVKSPVFFKYNVSKRDV